MNKHDRAVNALHRYPWASNLLRRIEAQGGIRKACSGYLFELRFAYELTIYCPTAVIQYEVYAGVTNSSVDFRIVWAGREWLIELMSLDESKTVRAMRSETRMEVSTGVFCERVSLDSTSPDPYRTPWGEIIRAEEKIEGKVWDSMSDTPRKFPPSEIGKVHVLLVDMTGFEGIGARDAHHCREIAFGSGVVREEFRSANPNTNNLVTGLFERTNTRRGAIEFRSRVDLLGFVAENPDYEQDDEIGREVFLIPNPARADREELIRNFPVRSRESLRNPLGKRNRCDDPSL